MLVGNDNSVVNYQMLAEKNNGETAEETGVEDIETDVQGQDVQATGTFGIL